MSKLVVAIAAAITLLPVGYAKAIPLMGATAANPGTNYSFIEETACWLPFQCAIGRHRVCYWHSHCQCVPCSGWGWHLWR